MSDIPDVPGKFENEEELKAYIDQLHGQIEFLEEELTESEREKLELKQELNDIENLAAQSQAGDGSFSSIQEPLEAIQGRLADLEQGKIEDLDAGPSEEAKEEFFEAAGWHPDDN